MFNNVFDGMHPTFKHVPPKAPLYSTHPVLRPFCPALIAAI
jgi:hypothetical protein